MLNILSKAITDRAVRNTGYACPINIDRAIAGKQRFEKKRELLARETKNTVGYSFIGCFTEAQSNLLKKSRNWRLHCGAITHLRHQISYWNTDSMC